MPKIPEEQSVDTTVDPSFEEKATLAADKLFGKPQEIDQENLSFEEKATLAADKLFGKTQEQEVPQPETGFDTTAFKKASDLTYSFGQNLRQNNFLTENIDPDLQAESYKLAKDNNVDTSFALQNIDFFRRKAKEIDYERFSLENPNSAKFLAQDPVNYGIAKDIPDELSKIEKLREKIKTTDSFASNLSDAYRIGSNSLNLSAALMAGAYGKISPENLAEYISTSKKEVEKLSQLKPNYVEEFNKVLAEKSNKIGDAFNKFIDTNYYDLLQSGYYLDALKGFVDGTVAVDQTLDLLKESVKNPKAVSYNIVQQIPNSLPAIGIGVVGAKAGVLAGLATGPFAEVASPVLGTVGFAGGSFAGSYFTEVGSWIAQVIQEKGYDLKDPEQVIKALKDKDLMSQARSEAENKGFGTASVDFAFNLVAGKLFAGAAKDASLLKKAAAFGTDVGVQAVGESASEYAGQKLARPNQPVNPQEVIAEGLFSLGQGISDTVIGSSIRKVAEEIKVAKGEPPIGGAPTEEAKPATLDVTQLTPEETAQLDKSLSENVSPEKAQEIKETNKIIFNEDSLLAEQSLSNTKDAVETIVDKTEKAQKIIHDVEVIKSLSDSLKESKLFERNEEKALEFLDINIENNEAKNLYIKKEDFNNLFKDQKLSPIKAFEALSDDLNVYYQTDDNENLEVNLNKFLTSTAKSENLDSLLGIIKTSPNGLSVQEARLVNRNVGEILTQLSVTARKQEQQRLNLVSEETQIKQNIAKQLSALYGKNANDMAAIIPASYKTRAEYVYVGETPKQIFDRENLTIQTLEKVPEGVKGFTQSDKEKRIKGFFDPANKMIALIKGNADLSTFLHETSHFFLNQLGVDYAYLKSLDKDKLTTKQASYLEMCETVLKELEVDSFSKLTVKEHEQFAKAFEKYLSEGKAPSSKLRKAFYKFQQWFLSIYKNIKSFESIQVSENLKNVFDRLLATEEEIENAKKTQFKNLINDNFTDPLGSTLSANVAARYEQAVINSKEEASNIINQKMLKDIEARETQAYKQKAEQIKKQYLKTLSELPRHKALISINDKNSGISLMTPQTQAKLFDYLGESTFEKYQNQIKLAESEIDPIYVQNYVEREMDKLTPAQLQSLQEDVQDALNNEWNKERLKLEFESLRDKITNPEMIKKLIARIPSNVAIKQQAIYTLSQIKVSEIKTYAYERAQKQANKDAAFYTSKAFAKNNTIEQANEFLYQACIAKQNEVLYSELLKQSYTAINFIKQKEKSIKTNLKKSDKDISTMRNIDLVNAARALAFEFGLSNRVEKSAESYLEKLRKYEPDTYNSIYDLIKPILDNTDNYKNLKYGDFQDTVKGIEGLWSLAKSIKAQEIQGKLVDTTEMVASLSESLIPFATKSTKENIKWGVELVRNGDFNITGFSFGATTTRIQNLIDVLALGDLKNPWYTYVWNPILDAVSKYEDKKLELNKTFIKPLSELQNAPGFIDEDFYKEIVVDEKDLPLVYDAYDKRYVNFRFKDKSELINFLLHFGNTSNKEKAGYGFGWVTEDINGKADFNKLNKWFQSLIDKKIINELHLDYIQEVWNAFEKNKPSLQKAHKINTGFYFNEITTEPFTIKFPDGKTKAYVGGYFPVKYDADYAAQVGVDNRLIEYEKQYELRALPNPGKGSLQERNPDFNARVSLINGIVPTQLDWSLRYANLSVPVNNVGRLIRNQKVKTLLTELAPSFAQTGEGNPLEDWLLTVAQNRVYRPETDASWLKVKAPVVKFTINGQAYKLGGFSVRDILWFIRTQSVAGPLFFNLTQVGQNFATIIPVINFTKPENLLAANKKYFSGFRLVSDPNAKYIPVKLINIYAEQALKESSVLRMINSKTNESFRQSYLELLKKENVFNDLSDTVNKAGNYLNEVSMNMMDIIAYLAVKDAALSGIDKKNPNPTEEEAIRYAESVVVRTQGRSNPIFSSQIQRGATIRQMIMAYFSYFNQLQNTKKSEAAKAIKEEGSYLAYVTSGKQFMINFTLNIAPLYVSYIIGKAIQGQYEEEKKKDKNKPYQLDGYLADFVTSQVYGFAAQNPFLGKPTSFIYNTIFTKETYDDKLNLGVSFQLPDKIANLASRKLKQFYSEDKEAFELEGRDVRDAFSIAGSMSSPIVYWAGKPLGYMTDVYKGNVKQPTGPIDLTRGLIMGKGIKKQKGKKVKIK